MRGDRCSRRYAGVYLDDLARRTGVRRAVLRECGIARAAHLRLERRPALDITRHTAAAFGVLAAAVEQTGRSPRPHCNDLWIASQAIEHGYALMTLNVPDFADLPRLSVIVPTSAGTS
ncbi:MULTISPECIES: hypothetical protein [Burkholderia]|uniref:Twitching motility protein PilT n=1 Tax=Burkholderia orbicola TaxID=2978683 RepID=A0ABT8NRX5_9BURK|nr:MULTISPECIES: hypothetical protein [Burkholderia]BEV50992.1 hypothetical protein BconGalA64_34910 [Burkholderia contaminans]MDN7483928.1 hypothetical protein [Burkholderia orbicola]MDN7524297.1 hypothetical protein [Burkholderia orbicola]MDN7731965.1 hypothetical protein [Burkholderia orbicola]UJH76207.1 hypothetical protein L0U95_30435 [Burkholderia cenocepacia]